MMAANTPTKLRTVRNIETGELTTQSSNKTKRLLKLGGYEEVRPGSIYVSPREFRHPQVFWRRIGIAAASVMVVLATLAWLRLIQMI